jgi:hypothetical protein
MTDYRFDHWMAEIHAILDGRDFSALTIDCAHGWTAWAYYTAQEAALR